MAQFPVISLELEGMRHSLKVALSEYAVQMDSQLQAAVDSYCEPTHLKAVISTIVANEIDRAVKEEVERFFRYGNGRYQVREAVNAQLATSNG